jgi:hypothetical protein
MVGNDKKAFRGTTHGRCLHTSMTLYGCHNGSFSYIPKIQKNK